MSPRASDYEAQEEHRGGDDDVTDAVGLSAQETKQGVFQRRDSVLLMSPAIISSPVPFYKRIQGMWRTFRSTPLSNLVDLPQRMLIFQWNKASVLAFRVHLSRTVRRIQHSKHARHAIKHAFGITMLAIPSFLPVGSAGAFPHLFHFGKLHWK